MRSHLCLRVVLAAALPLLAATSRGNAALLPTDLVPSVAGAADDAPAPAPLALSRPSWSRPHRRPSILTSSSNDGLPRTTCRQVFDYCGVCTEYDFGCVADLCEVEYSSAYCDVDFNDMTDMCARELEACRASSCEKEAGCECKKGGLKVECVSKQGSTSGSRPKCSGLKEEACGRTDGCKAQRKEKCSNAHSSLAPSRGIFVAVVVGVLAMFWDAW